MCSYNSNIQFCNHYSCIIIADIKGSNPKIFQGIMKDYHKKMPIINVQRSLLIKNAKKTQIKSNLCLQSLKQIVTPSKNLDTANACVFNQNPYNYQWQIENKKFQNNQMIQQIQLQKYSSKAVSNSNQIEEGESSKQCLRKKRIHKAQNNKRKINRNQRQHHEDFIFKNENQELLSNQKNQQFFYNADADINIGSQGKQFIEPSEKVYKAQPNKRNISETHRSYEIELNEQKQKGIRCDKYDPKLNNLQVKELLKQIQILSKQNEDHKNEIMSQRNQLISQKSQINSLYFKLFNLQGISACHHSMINQLLQRINSICQEKVMRMQ